MCIDRCPIAIAFHDAKPVETMSFIHHKSGHRTQVHTWAIPLRDKHGSIIGIIQTFEGEFAIAGPDPNDRSMKEHGWLDEVTGLPNLAMMQSHLRETLGTFTELLRSLRRGFSGDAQSQRSSARNTARGQPDAFCRCWLAL